MSFPKFEGLTENELPQAHPDKGDECEHCQGKGREKIGHSFFHGNMYMMCMWCGGTGSQKEHLERKKRFVL